METFDGASKKPHVPRYISKAVKKNENAFFISFFKNKVLINKLFFLW